MDLPTDLCRRNWIKRFVFGTAASLSAPHWCATLLAEPTADPSAVLRLRAGDYPPLANPGGSVQFVFMSEVHPFTLNRVSATRFVTLDSVCTHQGCVVGLYSTVHGRMRCPCHGSRYDIEGRVFRDAGGVSTEPAQNDLKQFATSYDAATDVISLTIPGLALAIHSIGVQQQGATGPSRLKLDFPVTKGAKYEVRAHATLDGPFTVVPFATSVGGIASQSELAPTVSGNATVFVNASGPRGFYVVALKLLPY
ncbi:Rieske 2Fe-2S domain-containing protein [Luteolibacter arcticus]|uniref:Rieske 2Fe-2S domain-containing protein n=1 Tax=Luteolibacter arcticus TaxID=1581411 RepID=A0ABT3GD91_9BACT|nr:Rieske 2Fe-2S domain-containing protein [Luteolibacter arcticus]MCW1921228.1 Rieske 2Fe-2S domain-containing protein [Luteolibacter arcticus]